MDVIQLKTDSEAQAAAFRRDWARSMNVREYDTRIIGNW